MLKGIAETGASLATILALLFSVITYSLSVEREAKIEIEKSRPYLQITFAKVDTEKNKGFIISNVGQGAARIDSFKYYLNQKAYEKGEYKVAWARNGQSLFTSDKIDVDELNILTKGRIIPQGPDSQFFLIRETEEEFYNRRIRTDMDSLIIEIEYSSLNQLDDRKYYLRYCESYEINHIRDRNDIAIYESNS